MGASLGKSCLTPFRVQKQRDSDDDHGNRSSSSPNATVIIATPLEIQNSRPSSDMIAAEKSEHGVSQHQPLGKSVSTSLAQPQTRHTAKLQKVPSSVGSSSTNTPGPLTATLKVSVRWNFVDLYVQFKPQPAKFEINAIQARQVEPTPTSWVNVSFDESVAKYKLCTAELEPETKYQLRCLIRVTSRPGQAAVPVTTAAAQVLTRKRMEILLGYEATRDFTKRIDNEVSFVTGDILESIECTADNAIPAMYAYVKNRRTADIGLAPIACLAQNDVFTKPASVGHQQYFYATADKRSAAFMLMRPNVASGVFLMRPSADASAENCIALSVRAGVENGVPSLAKFKIYYLADGYGCFIFPSKTFEDIEKLVAYYKTTPVQKNLRLTQGFVPPDDPAHQPTIEDIKIPKSSIEYGEKMGQGKFGNVYRGKILHLDVAIKELIFPEGEDEDLSADQILDEALVMARLFHDNIVKLIAVCVDSPPYCLISELMNGGSLKKYLMTPENRSNIEFETVIFILRQIADGMAYLEGKNFIHRDLRADNVLVHVLPNGSLEVKIADFGLSRMVPEGIYESTSRLLPIRWTAPEALSSLKFSLKSDVWSFGIIAFEVVTLGSIPYPGLRSNQDVHRAILSGVILTLEECQATDPALCSPALYEVMKSCWEKDPEKRTDFANLKSTFERFEEATEGQYVQ